MYKTNFFREDVAMRKTRLKVWAVGILVMLFMIASASSVFAQRANQVPLQEFPVLNETIEEAAKQLGLEIIGDILYYDAHEFIESKVTEGYEGIVPFFHWCCDRMTLRSAYLRGDCIWSIGGNPRRCQGHVIQRITTCTACRAVHEDRVVRIDPGCGRTLP